MRPFYFLFALAVIRPVSLLGDDPLLLALRLPGWPAAGISPDLRWSTFTRSYYCLSDWNASGALIAYGTSRGCSSALLYREGIRGYSEYHLLLSHGMQGKTAGATLQIGLSLVAASGRPPAFRMGAHLQATLRMGSVLTAEATVWDLPGWLWPGSAATRGNPAMRLLLYHNPGWPVTLSGGFRMDRSHYGPFITGVRLDAGKRLSIDGFIDLLPLGTTVSVDWRLQNLSFRISVAQRSGTGMTPMATMAGSF